MKPSTRISLGMVALTVSLVLTADWLLNLFPDPYTPVLEARADLSESFAIQYSSMATANRLPDMQPAMEAVVGQMPDVLSMNLRKSTGESLAITSEHETLWDANKNSNSTPTHVQIPIFQGENPWAVLEVRFTSIRPTTLAELLSVPLYKLITFIVVAGFIAYMLYLSRILRYLDPSSVVPSRVRAALNQLAEGIFILDRDQRIVLVNASFASKLSRTPESLIGLDPSDLPWIGRDPDKASDKLPWSTAIEQGKDQSDERLELQTPDHGICIFTAHVSLIVDGGGKQRGILASFNDITEIEFAHKGLKASLENLESANEEIQTKNAELLRLATIDPLTDCLNRRAFFEKFEDVFEQAVSDNLPLSVVMADIDFFKKINDDFGHATGDIVIKDMARTLTESVAPGDSVGRYGGEEFCLILVGSTEEDAKRISERARLAFQSLYESDSSPTDGRPITASFGISTLNADTDTVAEFINQADMALYDSKESGRNRVTTWLDLRAQQRKAG